MQTQSVQISDNFDSGNIRVIDASDISNIQCEIKHDNQSEFYQWFHFKLQTTAQRENDRQEHAIHLTNAGKAAYIEGWEDYQAVTSYDREHWFRVPTSYDGESLTITLTPEYDSVYFAYFSPYSYERHQDLLHNAQMHLDCQLQVLGQTIDGRDMSLLKIGEEGEGKRTIWLTARQHPGETMAEWFIEGFIDRLLDEDDGVARALLNKAVFYIVPNMNPDGSVRGHLRTNAVGANLNREWLTPSMERSPEVYLVREKMLETGMDMFLDVHGDEALPCNFIAGQAGAPDVTDEILAEEAQFVASLCRVNPDFQMDRGYEPGKFGPETLTVGSFWVGHHFKCPAMTIEMPFKDYDKRPDPVYGWSPERSRKLGASIVHPIKDWLATR